jgi:hypothetical protein
MNNSAGTGIEKLSIPWGLRASLAVVGREIARAKSRDRRGDDPMKFPNFIGDWFSG